MIKPKNLYYKSSELFFINISAFGQKYPSSLFSTQSQLATCDHRHTTMNDRSDENTVKRRKVRKGTHSCWECRRRKVRCTFALPEDAICTNCHVRGTKCARQETFDGPDTTESNTRHMEQEVAFDNQSVGVAHGTTLPILRDADVSCAPSTTYRTPVLTLHDSSPVGWQVQFYGSCSNHGIN